jgi:HEAT repeats
MRAFVSLANLIRLFGALGTLVAALCWSPIGHAADSPTSGKGAKGGSDAAPAAAPSTADVPRLAKAAVTGPAKAREEAIDRLADLGPSAKTAVPQLIEALKAKEPGVRWRAARALAAIGPAAADAAAPLAALLKDSDPHVRSHAAYALGAMSKASGKYASDLAALITDPEPRGGNPRTRSHPPRFAGSDRGNCGGP